MHAKLHYSQAETIDLIKRGGAFEFNCRPQFLHDPGGEITERLVLLPRPHILLGFGQTLDRPIALLDEVEVRDPNCDPNRSHTTHQSCHLVIERANTGAPQRFAVPQLGQRVRHPRALHAGQTGLPKSRSHARAMKR